ncbi:MAG: transporter substrate-binding protein [Gammaproteobacteria bacterium]|nr:transporter substrate-binding protein [Gammaproteobacteria bacterium]
MSNGTIKLGVMPPLTGLVGIYGSEIVHAAEVACQEINENGGVLGKPLELVIEDDGSLPQSAVAAAKKLVVEHQCSAMIGNLLSNSRIAVAYQVAEPSRVPLINFSFYEGSILSRYFFHFGALPNQQIDKMIPYMFKQYGSRMFFAGNNYEWPRGSIHAAKKVLTAIGGEIVGEEYCPIGVAAEQIEQLLDQLEAAKPDVFVPYFAGNDQVLLLTRFTERGLKKRMAVVMGHYDEMMASQLPAEVREGFYSSNTYFMTIDSEQNRNYLQRLARLADVDGIWPQGNGILTNFGEATYACVKAFAVAANSAGSVNAEDLVDALKNINISSPQGILTMNPEHHHATVNTYLSQCQSDGQFKIIERFGAIEAAIPERYNHQRITDQATVEDDIRLQARILEQMSDGVLLISSSDSSIIYSNAGAERILGYAGGEMSGFLLSQIMADNLENTQTSESIVKQLTQKGEWQGEISYAKKQGDAIWCFATVTTFTHPVYGEVWLAVNRDITEEKKSKNEIEQNRARFESMFEAIPDAVIYADTDRKIRLVNKAAVKLFGYEIYELEGRSTDILYADTEDFKEQEKRRYTSHSKTASPRYEMNYRCKDASVFSGETLATAVSSSAGEILGYLGIIRDVSERNQIDAIFRSLATGASGLKFDAFINDALYRLTEIYKSPFAFVGQLLTDGKHVKTLAVYANGRIVDNFEYALKGSPCQDVMDHKKEIIPKDASKLYAGDKLLVDMQIESYFGLPLIASDNSVIGILSIMDTRPVEVSDWARSILEVFATRIAVELEREISNRELRQHREHLQELVELRTTDLIMARDEAEKANAAKSEFLSHMSHELRTPMNAILGFGQLLEMDSDTFDETHKANIQEILDAGGHLLTLINEVLDLSRIESGKLDMLMKDIAVDEVLSQCLKLVASHADERQIEIIDHLSGNGYHVKADLTRLKQVFVNLLSNAIKYNRSQGAVTLDAELTENNYLRISVSDNGEGISKQDIDKLFKPFERLNVVDNVEGTGIGLVITKHLVGLMGGNIGVKSEPGNGSVFWIELPRC